MARIPIREIDLLIVEEIGKDISGSGMDTNVTGKFSLSGECEPRASKVNRIVVLDLSENTHGNSYGIGMADLITEKVYKKIDFHSTFMNCLTSNQIHNGKIPLFLPNDRDVITQGIYLSGNVRPENIRIVRIKNTLELDKFWVSDAIFSQIQRDKELYNKLTIILGPVEMVFDPLGFLAR
jgi:hypothetical protein